MANSNQTLTPQQKEYQIFANEREPKREVFKNCIMAFLIGGLICTIGQLLQFMFIRYFNFTEQTAANPTTAILIIAAILCTALGFYDHISQWAGAGTAVPVTGFANTMASAAIEYRSEGYVLGVGGNMFKLSGSVIVFGTFSAFIVVLIKLILKWMGVI